MVPALPVSWDDSQCDDTVRQHTWDFRTSGGKDKMLFKMLFHGERKLSCE